MKKAPSFFKFFIAERNNIDMEIPRAFTSRMEQTLPEKVYLKDRHNNLWIVKIAKVGSSWYLVDGWDKFVEDNLLTTGDILVFNYFSERLFHVKMYSPSASEKNVVDPSTRKGAEKMHEQASEYEVTDNIVDDHDYGTESVNHISISSKGGGDNNDDGDDENEETEDEDEDDDGDSDNNGVLMGCRENKHREVVLQNNDGVGGGSNTQRKLVYLYPKCYGMDIFEAGVAEQPINPYFVTKIMPKRKSDLFIPQDVIKDYGINMRSEIVLVDPNGREFNAKCKKWKDGRSIVSKGWRRLCRVNLVSLEDTCICEFVNREGDQRQFLYITFIRGNI